MEADRLCEGLEEICQLRIEDVYQDEGVWIIDINENNQENKLKNLPSCRGIPLHRILTKDLKFPQYVKFLEGKGERRVFPELRKGVDNRFSKDVSDWFARYRTRYKIVPDKKRGKKDFHSFRHTFINNLKQQGISFEMINEVSGHKNKGEGPSRYGKRYNMPLLQKKVISKLNYDFDFSHLKKSKFVKDFDFAYSKIERKRFKAKYNL